MALRYLLAVSASVAVATNADPNTYVSRIGSAIRGSGEGLLIESENELSQISLNLPTNAEPVFIASAILTNEFYIGDRNNSQLIVYDTSSLQQVDIISVNCNGLYHLFYNFKNQLWTVCDIDNTILVVDTETRSVIETIEIANVPDGYNPHDVTTSTRFAYVTLRGDGSDGYVIQYSTTNFEEQRRITVGGDPHVFINRFEDKPDYLFIASQASSTVYKVDSTNMTIEDTLSVTGAHGLCGNSEYLWVTGITIEDGIDSLYVVNIDDFSVRTYDTKAGSPHHVMINSAGNRLFITHTAPGAISVYDVEMDGGIDDVNGRILFTRDGSKPFGIMNLISLSEYDAIHTVAEEEDDVSDEDSLEQDENDKGFVDTYIPWILVAVGVFMFGGLVIGYCFKSKKSKNGLERVQTVETTEV